jgi:hypothetical protein
MLSDTEDMHNRALIEYALALMYRRTDSVELSEEHGNKALGICRELDQAEENFLWGTIIHELESLE